ncbi:23S rRNA pseudouridine2605 synthase [Formivibrio citricus]|uniref:Pseudouridine synthase n=1 Tax=Formivibrio citricus TaxID=83765 RepID=A0A1I4Y8J1_9NEIS|nr:pseudouridine synthase [Formivibrio citricus]SFN34392.1 23S rRNA pseudouridine2605 synthase [Formivibrio citricus]
MKSAPRARRPQPEIREQRTARNDVASLRAGKPQPGGRRRKENLDATDEWQTRPPKTAVKAPDQGRSQGGATSEGRREKRRDPDPAARAKRLKVRAGSQKEVAIQKQLRDKRLPAEQLNAERLQKALAFTGYGSRRDMEEAIEAGRVSVNGKVAKLGDKVHPGDEVRFDNKRVNIKWQDRLPRIVIYHKQEGELVSRDDPEGRTTVFDRLPKIDNSKWIAIGRLDFNTSGLLIFTTSGDLANKMMHPRFEVEREYAVRVLGELTDEQKKELLKGIELDDGPARFDRLADGGGEGQNHWYHVILREGRNREVRRMFEYYGMTVSRLMRVRFGALSLPPRLKRGQFYELNETEVLGVMKWAGLRMNGQEKTAVKRAQFQE